MEGVGIILWLVVAAIVGMGAEAVRASQKGFNVERLAISLLAATTGGLFGSEVYGVVSDWGPAVSGLNVLPAIIGAVVLAVLYQLGAADEARRAEAR